MTLKLKILAYRSLLGMYAASIIEEYTNEAIKEEWWYQNAYKVYKKSKGMKKAALKANDVKLLRNKLSQIRDLEEKHFSNDEWNPYALTIMCLEHLVLELDFIEFKGLLLDINTKKEIIYLEKNELYGDLQKVSYRYFNDIVKLLEV